MTSRIRSGAQPAVLRAAPAGGAVRAVLAVALAQVVTHLVAYGVYGLRVRALDSGVNTSIFGWVESLALAGAAGAALVLARRARDPRAALLGAALAIVLAVGRLAIRDDAPALAVKVVAAGVVLALLVDRTRGEGPAARLLGAAVALLAASIALHVLGPPSLGVLGAPYDSWPSQVKVAFEESSQTAAWALAGIGLARMARAVPAAAR